MTTLNEKVSALNEQTSAVMGKNKESQTAQEGAKDDNQDRPAAMGGGGDGGAGASLGVIQDVAYWLENLKGQGLFGVCEKLSGDIKGILASGARVVKAAAMAGQLRDQALQYAKALQEINTLKEGASLSAVAAQSQNAQNTNTAA